MGNPELAKLIRRVARSRTLSPAEKARRLQVGASQIQGIVFDLVPNIPGAQAVFQGAPRASDGTAPLLVLLVDGRMLRGYDDALIPDPSGNTSQMRILMNRLREL